MGNDFRDYLIKSWHFLDEISCVCAPVCLRNQAKRGLLMCFKSQSEQRAKLGLKLCSSDFQQNIRDMAILREGLTQGGAVGADKCPIGGALLLWVHGCNL